MAVIGNFGGPDVGVSIFSAEFYIDLYKSYRTIIHNFPSFQNLETHEK